MNDCKQKTVRLRIVNEFGHQEKELPVQSAVCEIRRQVEREGKWLYVDGRFTLADTLTEADLEIAGNVLLANALEGG